MTLKKSDKLCELCRYWQAMYQMEGTCVLFERRADGYEDGCDEWEGE